jgi:hypothetical protein
MSIFDPEYEREWDEMQREVLETRCRPNCWKGNPNHMLIGHNGGCHPTHDPPKSGCESCGYVEEDGVENTHLAWAADPAWSYFGQWLCMECH